MSLLAFLLLALILPVVANWFAVRKFLKTKRKIIKIPVAIAVTIATWVVLFQVFAWLFPNPAQKEFRSTFNMHSLQAKLICDNGDPGVGPDNTQPWYSTFYKIPDDPDLTAAIKQMASSKKFNLTTDTTLINDIKTPKPDWEQSDPQPYDKNNDYLIAQQNGIKLNVAVYRSGTVLLKCDHGAAWDQPIRATTGTNIVTIDVTMPDR